MRTVGVHEAKTHLSRLLREVQQGDEILITRGDEPVAKLVQATPRRSVASSYGMSAGKYWLPDGWDDDPDDEMAKLFGITD